MNKVNTELGGTADMEI